MKLTSRAIRLATAGAMVGGLVAVAAPAHATTTPRGATTLMSCDDVVVIAKAGEPTTKKGLVFTTQNLKVAGIAHPEKAAPSAAGKNETDVNVTPDVGDTDTCTGLLLTNANPWTASGNFAPYTPIQGQYTSTLNEIVGVAGSLTGRSDCDSSTTNTTSWTLHGKLTVKLGSQGAPGTPLTAQALTTLGVKVQSQVYVAGAQPTVAPSDINGDTDTGDAGETVADLVDFAGIAIKGTGEGAWYDHRTTFRPQWQGGAGLIYAAEACQFNADLNMDGTIGQPGVGGLTLLATDTDVDTATDGNPLAGPQPHYDNSAVLSI